MDVCKKKINKIKEVNKVLKSTQNASLARTGTDREAAMPLCLLLYSTEQVRHLCPLMLWAEESTERDRPWEQLPSDTQRPAPSLATFLQFLF